MGEDVQPVKSGAEASGGDKPTTGESMPPAQIIPVPEWDRSPYETTFRIGTNMVINVMICWLSVGIAVEIGFGASNEWDLGSVIVGLFWWPLWYFLNSIYSGTVELLFCIAAVPLFIFAIVSNNWKTLLCRCFLLMLTVWINLIYAWLHAPVIPH